LQEFTYQTAGWFCFIDNAV